MSHVLKRTSALLILVYFLLANPLLAQNPMLSNPSACGLGLSIQDNSCPDDEPIFMPNRYDIVVSTAPGTALGVDVYLKEVRILIEHPWAGDLDIVLQSPGGIALDISSDNGGGDDNYGDPSLPACAGYTTFSVTSCTPVDGAQAPFTGIEFQPEESFYLYNDGSTNPNGTWELIICDDVEDHAGTLQYVELVFESISCLPPVDLTLTEQDTTSLNLTWDPNGACGTIIMEYGTPGFVPGVDSTAGQGQVMYTECPDFLLEGLSPETEYDIYIRKYCGSNFSINSCPITIVTGCQPAAPTIKTSFDEETICSPPYCGQSCDLIGFWQNNPRDDSFDWMVHSGATATFGTGPSDDANGGGNYVYLEASGLNCNFGNAAYLMSNCFELQKQGSDTCHVSFNYHMFGDNIGKLRLEVSSNGGFTWQRLWERTGNQGDQWMKAYIGLDAFNNGDLLQFRFVGEGGSGSEGDIALDNIVFYGSVDLGTPTNRFYVDTDGDGYGDPNNFVLSCAASPVSGYVADNTDCNDNDQFINPGADETPCDGVDNNCNAALIDDDPILPAVQVTGDTVCSGSFGAVCATPAFGGFIFWYDSPTSIDPVGVGTCYFPTLPANNGPFPITYTFYAVEDNFVCRSGQRAAASIVVNPRPDISTIDVPSVCPGESFDLSSINIADANFAGGTITFHDDFPADETNELASTIVNPQSTTTYYFLSTTPNGCTDQNSVTVQVKPGPNLTFTPGLEFDLCRESEGTISVQPSGGAGGYTYEWSTGATGNSINIEGDFFGGTLDSYGVTVTDSDGCFTEETVMVTTSSSIDSVLRTVNNVTICNGADGAINITPLNGIGPFAYTWEGSNGITGSVGSIASTYSIDNLPQGEYNITVTDNSPEACDFVLKSVVVNGPSAVISNIEITDASCYGSSDGSICLEISGDNPEVLWSNGATTPCIFDVPAGIYSVRILDGECENILSDIEIGQPDSMFVKVKLTEPLCSYSDEGIIDVTVYGGVPDYNYAWNIGSNEEDLIGVGEGLYAVTVTDANNCQVVEGIELIAPEELAITVDSLKDMDCPGAADGYAQVSVVGGTSPYDFAWNTGSNSAAIGNLDGGTYALTVTDFNGCTDVILTFIREPAPITLEVLASENPECVGDGTGVIFVQATGGLEPYSYMWNTGHTDSQMTNLGVGEYSVTVTDANNCPGDTVDISLNAISTLDLDIAITEPTCTGQTDGQITLSPNGTMPFSFDWGEGISGATRTNIGVGDYPVTIEDGQGCIYDTSITVNGPQLFDVDLSIVSPSCHDAADGFIDVNLLATGTPPLDFNWSTGSDDMDLGPVAPGNYFLTITDANDCAYTSDTLVIDNPPPLTITISGLGNLACSGESGGYIETIVTGGVPPYEYTWSGAINSDQPSIFNLSTGNYNLVVLDDNQCAVDTSVVLTEPEPLEAVAVIDQGTLCEEPTNKLRAEVSGGIMPYTFEWSNGATDSCIVNASPGDYELTVTDANNCSDIVTSIKVRELFQPIKIDSFIVKDITCNGAQDGSMTAYISGGAPPYRFHFSNNHIVETSENSASCINLPLDFDYRVTVSSLINGCSAVSRRDTILEPPLLIFNVDSTRTINCFGGIDGAIYTSITGGVPGYTYEWYDVLDMNTVISTDAELINVPSGTYIGFVTDQNGCTESTPEIEVSSPNDLLQIVDELTIVQNVACRGDSTGGIDISPIGGQPPYTFMWSNGQINEDLQNVPAGEYGLMITDIEGCKLTIPPIGIGEPVTAIEIEASLSHLDCYDVPDGVIDVMVEGGALPYDYTWELDDDILSGQDSSLAEGLYAGIYTLGVQDANGCIVVREYTLDAPPPFSVELVPSNPVPPFDGEVQALAEGGVPGYSYLWHTGDTTMSIPTGFGGVYSVTVTDENDCITADTLFLVNNELIDIYEQVELFPNPNQGTFNLNIQLKDNSALNLQIYDILGRKVYQQQLPKQAEHQVLINLNTSPSGTYFVRLESGGSSIWTEKVLLLNE